MAVKKNRDGRWWVALERFQKQTLEWTIEYTGSVNKAATYLGLNAGYVYKLVRKYGLETAIREYGAGDEAAGDAGDAQPEAAPADAPAEADSFDDDEPYEGYDA